MSDNLEWRRKHAILFLYPTVQEAVSKGCYAITPEVEPFVVMDPMPSEDFVTALMAADRHKEVCDFLAYAMHRRAAVWWGYQVILAMRADLKRKMPVSRDIADIGAPKPFAIPDWAKMPDLDAERAEAAAEIKKSVDEMEKAVHGMISDVRSRVSPNILEMWDACIAGLEAEFKDAHGLTMEEVVRKAAEKEASPEIVFSKNSPIVKEAEALKAQIEQVRQATIKHIKTVLPPVDMKRRGKLGDDAMDAVFRWVAAPDEVNTQKVLDCGNACTDLPAGQLALAAAWAYGDLNPTGDRKVPVPPGLSGNGLKTAVFNAALHKGGELKFPERYEIFAKLGVEVLEGKNLWADAVIDFEPPHDGTSLTTGVEKAAPTPSETPPASPAPPPPPPPRPAPQTTYRKWGK